MTIEDAIHWVNNQFEQHDLFYGHGTDNAWDEACFLVLSVMQLPPDADQSVAQKPLTSEQWDQVQALAEKRIRTRTPLPYLLGESWFAGLPFYVNEHVLVPRSPLAELIQQQFMPWAAPESIHNVLDLCTGSGCIGIATAYHLPWVQVTASDICPQALEVAQRNVNRHGLADRVTLIQSDLLTSIPSKPFDIIVTNPPYVDNAEMSALPNEYRHEPELGLASGQDGLDATRTILKEAAHYLSDNGLLIVEVGASAAALEAAFPRVPFTWLEFSEGGDGVFLLTKEELNTHFKER